jgi:hypothetical protein
MLLASLTIWCSQTTLSVVSVPAGPQPADGMGLTAPSPAMVVVRYVEPALASLPHALGSLSCLVAGLALLVGTPFDQRYAAIAAFGVALYLVMINLSHLIEDWQNGVAPGRMLCTRSLLPTLVAAPMLLSGLRLL